MNPYLASLPKSYLFPEIQRRIGDRKVLNLGIGDTSQPLPACIAKRMAECTLALAAPEGYRGYGDPFGDERLRAAIASVIYDDRLSPEEIFVSDGAKSDLARLMHLFAPHSRLAIQTPAYPAFVEAATIAGHRPVSLLDECDGMVLCSPNNPTGKAMSRDDFLDALDLGVPIINDAAYAAFITSNAPKTIFALEEARELAIEVGSFSKLAGFTGVRLGWTAIARENPLYAGWKRILSTLFNGASLISQAGGLAALENWNEVQHLLDYYKENGRILAGHPTDAPYIWLEFPGRNSWDLFDEFLQLGIAVTPGVGFGSAGEGFIRLSALGARSDIEQAAAQLRKVCQTPSR